MTSGHRSKPKLSLFHRDHILVCGLGSLGQHCVANLKTFGVRVNAIELIAPTRWEIPNLPELIETLIIGDCRQSDVLEQANVRRCRAILMLTTDERVNLEAALSARVLNPQIRLVLRSEKQNLNDLLEKQLENFIAFEPTQLAAPAFALEALGEEMIGFFKIDQYQFRVVKREIGKHHRWRNCRQVHEINTRDRRVLRYLTADSTALSPAAPAPRRDHPYSPSTQFYTWLPDSVIQSGDVVVTVEAEAEDTAPLSARATAGRLQTPWHRIYQTLIRWQVARPRRAIAAFWKFSYRHQIRRVALLCSLTVVALTLLGTVLMVLTGTASLIDGIYTTIVLLLGGYADLFGELAAGGAIPWWLRLFSLGLTLAGTAFIGVLYALLTEQLLTLKFEFLTKRPPIPEKGHVVVISLGRVGRRVMQILQDLKQPVVGITRQALEPDVLPQVPIMTGKISDLLQKVNLSRAKSVVAVSDDEIQNLELGLMAYHVNPHSRLIIRTYDQSLTDRVASLFPYAQVLCTSALSAEAFAGAAFGENVIGLFRLYHQTALVTQYNVQPNDTLCELLLADVAYGYGVVPIWHQAQRQLPNIMPSDDVQLGPGDRLIVLSTIRGLRRIEQGDRAPKQWQVQILKAPTTEAVFEGSTAIARITGCHIGEARALMQRLPATFPYRMYLHQAIRLVRQLGRLRVHAKRLPLEDQVGRGA